MNVPVKLTIADATPDILDTPTIAVRMEGAALFVAASGHFEQGQEGMRDIASVLSTVLEALLKATGANPTETPDSGGRLFNPRPLTREDKPQ